MYLKLSRFTLLIAALFFLFPGAASSFGAAAAVPVAATRLEDITVSAGYAGPTRMGDDQLYSASEISPAGLELAGVGGLSSVYRAFAVLPGINPELTDPTGIGSTEMRLRGIKTMFSGLLVEGIPSYGIMGVGPRDYIFDLENMDSIKLYRGATPAAVSSGIGNRGGTIELNYARPGDDFSLLLDQSIGSNRLRRSFFRLDSGTLPGRSKFFLSGSYTKADKWKGAGEVGGRNHMTIGVSRSFSDNLDVDIFYNYNQVDQDLYKGLNYAAARCISQHYDDDYLEELTGTPADQDYYKYNRSETRNNDLTTVINYRLNEDHSFSLKPYFSTEDKKWTDGGADKYVDGERIGAKFEYAGNFSGTLISAGYWYENYDLEKYIRKNKIDARGRNYAGWAYLAENRGRGQIHTPYVQVDRGFGPFSLQAGVKYLAYHEPASRAYLSNKNTPYDYERALHNNLGLDREMTLAAMNYRKWLPSISLGYHLSAELDFYLNYGRNYMRPYAYVPMAMVYSKNRAKFQAAGLSLQDLCDRWQLETSDNFDLGCRWQQRWFDLAPTLFYARHRDLLFVAFDEQVGVNYHQNVGNATAFGGEVELNIYPLDNLVLFFNPSYTRTTFDDDLSGRGRPLEISGNDLPDSPRWLLKTGFILRYHDFSISPTLKYVDQRYGDIENREKIDAYTTVDLKAGYRLKNLGFLRQARLELEFTNLFGKKYVGSIKAEDDGFKASQYYSGVPFTTICRIRAEF